MKTLRQQFKKFHQLILIFGLVLALVVPFSLQILQAQDTQPAKQLLTSPDVPIQDIRCQQAISPFLVEQKKLYQQFLETHFSNKSSSSSLLDVAFDRYKEYRESLMNEYAKYYPQQGTPQVKEGLEPSACLGLIDVELANARQMLKSKALKTSVVKQATALTQKYQDLNEKLRTLNQNIVWMKTYLDTFAEKLPCYVHSSCIRG